MNDVAFYCISSELYFPGAVGLVNSLRMAGHTEAIHVLDCGLTETHRRLLEREVNVIPAPDATPPYLLKTVAPLRHPSEVMVLIDVDMVVARSLRPLIDGAANGVIAVRDNIDRFVPEWGDLLDLGTARPRPYVSSGLVVLGGPTGRRVLEVWDDRQRRVDYDASFFERDERDYPFRYIDQDVLNAILCTAVEPGRVTTLDPALAPVPPFRRIRPLGREGLRCVDAAGNEPYVIHQFVRKPWLEPMYHGIYSELLRRAWLSPSAPLRYPPEEIPLRMRTGLIARLERRRVDAFDLARWYVRDVIPDWIEGRRRRAGATR